MRILLFAKMFALFTGLAMVGVFVSPLVWPSEGALGLVVRGLQFEALAVALTIGAMLLQPHDVIVRKGDTVLVIMENPVNNSHSIHLASALQNGKLHEEIQIQMDNASTATGRINSNPGILWPARVGIKIESTIKVI